MSTLTARLLSPTKKLALLIVAGLVCLSPQLAPQAAADQPQWKALFDGQTLDGFVQRGGKATYRIEDQQIVGTSVPHTPNTFLCTDRDYGDFVLEYEFKVHPELNSGVQIRSLSLPEVGKGRVHGYQVEIDPSLRGWTTGIYDEGRRGWLYPLEFNKPARYAFRQNQWNHVRVQAIGDSIKTWLNGVPAADLVDGLTLRGFIALQVHGVGGRQDPVWIRWRNLRILDLGQSKWQPLFDGQTLDGWSPLPGGKWEVQDGVIRGTSPASESRHGILLSDKKYGDFTARVVFRANSGNSGFYFRCQPGGGASVQGFQAEIDAKNDVGGLYETGGRGWVIKPDAKDVKKYFKPGKWNEMIVSARGGRVVVTVNGRRTAELLNDKGRAEGHLGLQLHGGQDMDVEFKSIEILETSVPYPTAHHVDGQSRVVDEYPIVKTLKTGFKFTEGPAPGPDGNIYFTDIPNQRIHKYDINTGEVSVFREQTGAANGLMFAPGGALLACQGGSHQLTRQAADGTISVLAESFDGKQLNSPNDLAIDGQGGVYFTDPRYGNRDDMQMQVEGVYYRPRRGELIRVIDDMVRPNGLVLSRDQKHLYVADNGAATIWKYDVGPGGALSNGKLWVDMGKQCGGGGDGMTIDERGNIYCAGAGAVWVWNPEGQLLTSIHPPESPANCVFGGVDGKTLFITARKGFYQVQMNVAGH